MERSYIAKYPGDSGTAMRALCQELLTRLAGTDANAAGARAGSGTGARPRGVAGVLRRYALLADPAARRVPIDRQVTAMPSTVFDSDIFRDAFGSAAMRAIFSDRSAVARYVEVEVALAAAEASVGVIPTEAAAAIERLARADAIDLAKLKAETDLVGYPIVGVVHQLAKQCGEAGRYVHWGATTQDIMDTATVLQIGTRWRWSRRTWRRSTRRWRRWPASTATR